uniref:uncharacterized protein LOC122607512 isoform X2 n=1 Tax=Erigeron canadensis TaxID=72917 RepID=UPI001CB8B6DA|nr:uncharacterized protein LOC122607512 isoform X2 [Erigeron canadensis]
MNNEESGWILEFLLRQPSIDDTTLNNLINVLPIPNNNNNQRFKKTLILRKLETHLEKGTIFEHTIELLEQLEQLDHLLNNTHVSESLKTAYSTVVLHCTAKLIEKLVEKTDKNGKESDENKKGVFDNVVKSIWVSRIEAKNVGLFRDDLIGLVSGIETGVVDVRVWEKALKMYEGVDVFEVVRRYVNGEKEKMGPPFLELACEVILTDDGLRKVMGLDDGDGVHTRVDDGAGNVAAADGVQDLDGKRKRNDALKTRVLPIHKQVSPRRPRGSGPHRGAKIVDPLETSHDNYDSIPTPEVNKVQEALETSSKELQAVVKDPLLDALRLAESFKSSKSGDNIAHDHIVDNSTMVTDEAPSSSHDRKGKALEANGDDNLCGNQNKRRKLNLMERNETAHTVEAMPYIYTAQERSYNCFPSLLSWTSHDIYL